MSIYSSLKITKGKAKEIVDSYVESMNDEQLKELASHILSMGERYNIYQLVESDEPSDDKLVSE